MRLAGLRSLLYVAVAALMSGTFAGCDNPFDPINKSDKIQGFAYFDFDASQEHWDADAEWDGLSITLNYYNEYGDQLSFHDKTHDVKIEFWSQKSLSEDDDTQVRDSLLFSKTVEFTNSDDLIRIPIESYMSYLPEEATESSTTSDSAKMGKGRSRIAAGYGTDISGCLLVRIYPPQEDPQKELSLVVCEQDFFTAEETTQE